MIEKILNKLTEANKKYRDGNPIMSDYDYDQLLEILYEYDPENEYFNKVGIEIIDNDRKRILEYPMASMNKAKTINDIKNWLRLKGISTNTEIVCTPKFDGLSLLVNELNNTATTRGNGVYGQKSDEHYKLIQNHLKLENNIFTHTYGEVIIPKKVFLDKYSINFANPRNLVAGLINSKETTPSVSDIQFIKYGAVPNANFTFTKKSDILDTLNSGQEVKVDYHLFIAEDITENYLIELFKKWSVDYEIDGIILEVNDIKLQEELGRETSTNNPNFSIAFKHSSFEQSAETEVLDIEWNISKNSLLKPVAIVKPINLDGVVVSRCTLNNARFVKDMGIGIGAKVVIRRSGLVIPKIVDVLQTVEFKEPTIEGVGIGWNEAGIELVTLTETDDQKLKSNISFFEVLGCDNVGEGVISNLYNFGYKTIRDILNLNISDLEKLDGFGKRKAKIVFESIEKSIKNVQLSKLQHATNIFVGMGSKKLALLEHFKEKPTVEQVMEIDGFAEISAKTYVDNYDNFFDFIKDLPVTIVEKVEVVKTSNDLDDMVFVFTGIRMKPEEAILESRGAKIGGSVSKATTHLVCKDPNGASSKLEKAKSLGIKIIGVEELKSLLK